MPSSCWPAASLAKYVVGSYGSFLPTIFSFAYACSNALTCWSKTNTAPGLLVGGIEFTDALATLDVVAVELQAAIKASTPSAPAPTKRAERRKKLLRLRDEDPKFSSVPMKDLLKIEPPVNEQIF